MRCPDYGLGRMRYKEVSARWDDIGGTSKLPEW